MVRLLERFVYNLFFFPVFSHHIKESDASEFILYLTQIERPQPDLPQTEEQLSEGEEVPCDICQGDKSTSVKSCLVCQTSYCELHLTAHRRDPALQRHRLTEPATFPSNHLCRKHNKPLTMFCKKDQMPVCVKCTERDHKRHESVPMEKESKRIKVRKSLFYEATSFKLRDWNILSQLVFFFFFLLCYFPARYNKMLYSLTFCRPI